MKRKIVTIFLVVGVTSAIGLSIFAMKNKNNKIIISTTGIKEKREHINDNPYIPQEKKDLINNKLDIKESIIEQTDIDNTATNYITESKAKAIALEHAQLKESEVRIKKVKFDHDHDRAEYEIEFHQGRTEYEYTIDATTGQILDYDMDYDD